MGKINVAIIYGGRSAEHEISLLSAQNVVNSIDKEKYEPVLIGIDRDGKWYLNKNSMELVHADNPALIKLSNKENEVALTPTGNKQLVLIGHSSNTLPTIDVLFPVLHGPFGEDGTIQGLAKLADLPCVGPGVLGSSIGMDKDIMKRLLRDAAIPNAQFVVVSGKKIHEFSFKTVSKKLGNTLFIKPANMGSSVGVSKVTSESEFNKALEEAFHYDLKVIIEEEIKGREIECAVLGNENPKASALGEIIPQDGFYSYKSKYLDEKGAVLEIPAKIDTELTKKIQEVAVKTFQTLECIGMSRVDMFVTDKGKIYVNEINTIPGFTKISMYPKLWEYSGISYTELIDKLIQLAIDDFENRKALKVTV